MKKLVLVAPVFFLFLWMSPLFGQRIMSPQLVGYVGIGNIFYTNGFYQGQIYNGVAHGNGTYYFRDGTIYQGMFYDGWRNGPGVLIVPFQGYLPSCWQMGAFVGQECNTPQQGPTYSSRQQVERTIRDTYDDFPDEADFVANDPDDYEIVQINSNTQLGRTLLGKYSGN